MKKIANVMLAMIIPIVANAQDYIAFQDTLGKYGFRDQEGKIVVAPKFDATLGYYQEGLVAVKNGKKWGFADITGKLVIPCKYDEVTSFCLKGFAQVYLASKTGLVDKSGKEFIPVKYLTIDGKDFNSDYDILAVGSEGKQGVLNLKGATVVPFKFEELIILNAHLVKFREKGKVGVINTNAKKVDEKTHLAVAYEILIPSKYDEVGLASDDLIKVERGDKWGLINTNGVQVLSCEYDQIGNLVDGKIQVFGADHNPFYVDSDGKRVEP